MNHVVSYSRGIILIAGLLASLFYVQAKAASAPAEQTSVVLKHTATSANPMAVTLSKNLFKTETYDAEYTVQVPYEATEKYSVQIPYETTERYSVEIPYQTTETYTERVPYTEQVAYTDYETDYRSEYKCHDRTSYRNECHNEQKCYLVPDHGGGCRSVEECGINAHGERICKTRQVCDGGGTRQQCDNQQVCRQVPYNDRQCGYEQVPYRREVTRYRTETHYRNETRTRTVTKYRTEYRERTVTKHRTEYRERTVTKYRTETRCCKPATREVFDRQLQFQVSVAFPQEAVLTGKEVETIKLSLVSADPAQVEIKVGEDSIYGYKIAKQDVSGASIMVELAMASKYNLENAGPSTIKDFKVDYSTTYDRHRITFSDSFKASGVASEYVIVVTDAASGNFIEEIKANAFKSDGKSVTRITTALSKKQKVTATLKVKRVSPKMPEGALEFEVAGQN